MITIANEQVKWPMTACRNFIAIVVLLPFLSQAGTLDFVRDSLGFDLSRSAFGTALTNYANPVLSKNSVSGQKIEWYRTSISDVYEAQHPGRTLEFGFTDGRLASLRFFVTSFDSDKEKAKKLKASLDGVFTDFQKLEGKGFDGAIVRQDHDLQIRYEPLCSPMENFFATISVTPQK